MINGVFPKLVAWRTLSSCYPEKTWSESSNTTWKANLREGFQLIRHPVKEVYSPVSDGETSFVGHLVAVQKQRVTENLCALPLARHSETQRKPQGWALLERTCREVKRPRDRKKSGRNGQRVSISAPTTVNNPYNNNDMRISYVADTALNPLETFNMVESAYCPLSLQSRKRLRADRLFKTRKD